MNVIERIAKLIRPHITELSHAAHSDCVRVELWECYSPNTEDVRSVDIPHNELREWLEEGNYLFWDNTHHVQEGGELVERGMIGEYGYIEFVEDPELMTQELMYKFLAEKQYTHLPFQKA
jgi:hypothetical protein